MIGALRVKVRKRLISQISISKAMISQHSSSPKDNFRSWSSGFKSCWRRNSDSYDCMAPHYTEPFIITIPSSRYDLTLVMLNKKMLHPLLIFYKSDHMIQAVDTISNTEWQTVQIQISWLLKKPTDLDLHCLQRQGISGFSRTRVK